MQCPVELMQQFRQVYTHYHFDHCGGDVHPMPAAQGLEGVSGI